MTLDDLADVLMGRCIVDFSATVSDRHHVFVHRIVLDGDMILEFEPEAELTPRGGRVRRNVIDGSGKGKEAGQQ